jgi:hypothetical protein
MNSIQKDLLQKRWRKGGYTPNGLRQAAEVRNYFPTPGRMNLIPDATSKRGVYKEKAPISSIGIVDYNPNKLISEGDTGPGTLLSSNVQFRNQNILNEMQLGFTRGTPNKIQFVDYRSTAPFLIENLRTNPLSIYAVGDAKQKSIPSFYANVSPEYYESYISVPNKVFIDKNTIQNQIDGNPQTNILGLAEQNPFLGLTVKVNDTPEFSGKVYGGNNKGEAKPIADALYNSVWTNYMQNPVPRTEYFGAPQKDAMNRPCQNMALAQFAQGYNVAPQINSSKTVQLVGPNHTTTSNLPWGPKKGGPNQGGLWFRGNNPPADMGFKNMGNVNVAKPPSGNFTLPPFNQNCYTQGLPGSLICN